MNRSDTQIPVNDQNIRILIVADNASTDFGGEAFLPLMYFKILKKRGMQVCLMTHARNREALISVFGPDDPDLYFLVDTELNRIAWRICSRFPAALRDVLSTMAFSVIDFRRKGALVREIVQCKSIDVIHQPTPVSPRLPSGMHRFGVPLVIGPMNGGMGFPQGFETRQKRIFRWARRMLAKAATPLNLLFQGKRRAYAVLVANERTRKVLPVRAHPNVIAMSENGVDLNIWGQSTSRRPRRPSDPFRLVFIGRLVEWKAVDITLDAVKMAREAGVDCRLTIIGSGSADKTLRRHCDALGLADVVEFHPYAPQSTCSEHLSQSDALILNSLYECGGAVVLEAMAAGRPVIASDWGGASDYLNESCGILVAPTPSDDFAQRLGLAIRTLAQDPALCQSMGAAGRRIAQRDYDWETKVDRLIEVFIDAACRKGSVSPRLGGHR